MNKIKDLQKPFWINELRKIQWNQELSETHEKTQRNQELAAARSEMCSGIIELGEAPRNRLRRALELVEGQRQNRRHELRSTRQHHVPTLIPTRFQTDKFYLWIAMD